MLKSMSVFAIFTIWPGSVSTLASVNCTRCKGAVWAANGRAVWAGDLTHHDSGGDVPFRPLRYSNYAVPMRAVQMYLKMYTFVGSSFANMQCSP